jgi:hypothetical protein
MAREYKMIPWLKFKQIELAQSVLNKMLNSLETKKIFILSIFN